MKKGKKIQDPESGNFFRFGFWLKKCPGCGNKNSVSGMEFDGAAIFWCCCDTVFNEKFEILKKAE